MSLDGLLSDLANRGVSLEVESGQLKVKAKKGVLTAELRETLAANKPELIARLQGRGEAPLSSTEQRLWFLDQYESNRAAFNVARAVQLRGPLDKPALSGALNQLVARHEALRATYHGRAGGPVRRVTPEAAVEPAELSGSEEQLTEQARRPFDLAHDVLLRAALQQLGAEDHILLLCTHQIAADKRSLVRLLHELGELYSGAEPAPPPAAGQGDGAAFWRDRLAGAPPLLQLTTDFPRPPLQTLNGSAVRFDLGSSDIQSVVALAAFETLLHRYTGADCILVGYSAAEPLDHLLVDRAEFEGDPTFEALVKATRSRVAAAAKHQSLPFARLIEMLQPERNPSRPPLVEASFAFDEAPHTPSFRHLETSWHTVDTETATLDLELSLEASGGRLQGELRYNSDLFRVETIRGMAGHYRHLLEAAMRSPEDRVSSLPMLAEDERSQLLAMGAGPRPDYPSASIAQLFEQRVREDPTAVAVVCGDQRLTYEELNLHANRLAHRLRDLGVETGATVAILADRSAETIAGLLAILKAGGTYLGLDPEHPPTRLAFQLEDAGATLLLAHSGRSGSLPKLPVQIVPLDEPGPFPHTNLETAVSPDDVAYIAYTSGSTGQPKGAAIPHRGIVRMLFGSDYTRFGREEACLHLAPLAFDASTFEIWAPLVHGGTCVVFPGHAADFEALEAAIRDHGVTVAFLTTALFNRIIDERPETLASVREVLTGGEAISVRHVRRALEALPKAALVHCYGPAEGTTFTTCYRIPSDLSADAATIPIGRPIANTGVYVIEPGGHPAPIGVPGELWVSGDGLARGYLNRPEQEAACFLSDPFSNRPGARVYRTGDIARWRPDGNLEFVGRRDSQIKIRGHRVELGEIEATLASHPAVAAAAVTAGKRLVAFVVPAAERPDLPAELRELVRGRLPDFMRPARYVLLDRLPATPNGKVDRAALAESEPAGPDPEATFIAPRGKTEAKLAGIWEELLGLKPIGVRQSFFEMGGHSLLAVRLMARVEEAFGRKIPLVELFQTPTVEHLARRLAAHVSAAPLSFAQQRLWFLDQYEPDSPLYNIADALHLEGPLDRPALASALNHIVARHDTLRTTFRGGEGEPVQLIAAEGRVEIEELDVSTSDADRRLTELARQPYDLARDPMLRVALLRLSEREHILFLCIHHIAADGWSLGVLFRELGECYNAAGAGREPKLPELSMQYAEFARWQRERLTGRRLDEHVSYWKGRLAGCPALLQLPTDHPRQAVQTFNGAAEPFALAADLSASVREFARGIRGTPYMVLLGALQALLHRYTGQTSILVGSPVDGRVYEGVEHLIGFFVNTVVQRSDFPPGVTFTELLRDLRRNALDAYEHQEMPFERLVDLLETERNLSYSPVFQVMLAYDNTPSREPVMDGLELSLLRVHTGTAKFDLLLGLLDRGGAIHGELEYNTDLFDAPTVQRLAGHFRTLLAAAVEEPDRPIDELPLLSPGEREQMLVGWNHTAAEAALECLHHQVERRARENGSAVALEFGDRQVSYAELEATANRIASNLRDSGVARGARVGVRMDRSPDAVASILAILKLRAAYVPIEGSQPEERINLLVEDAGLEVLLSEAPTQSGAELEPEQGSLDDLLYVGYTSGSTGRPKGVAMPHRPLANLIAWQSGELAPAAGLRVAHLAPLSFDVSCQEVFSTLAGGGVLVIVPEKLRRSPVDLWRFLETEGVERLFLPFVLLDQLAEVAKPGPDVRLREVISAGEQLRITPKVRQLFAQMPGCRLINHYGPTETHVVTAYELTGDPASWPDLVPIGKPIANTQAYVLTVGQQPAPIGVSGELLIGGAPLADGYLGRPDLTAERFVPNPFGSGHLYRTGDVARWRPDGNLEFLGRRDFQVKIRGYRVELGEVEATLGLHARVAANVVNVSEKTGERSLVAFVVPTGDPGGLVGELRDHARGKLPDYMCPARYVLVDRLPLTATGKVDRLALAEPDIAETHLDEDTFVAPRNETEEKLARIWERLLGVRPVGIRHNFFDLGGHSLLTVRLTALIEKTFGRKIPVVELFRNPTIESLAELVTNPAEPAGAPGVIPLQPGGESAPLIMVHPLPLFRGLGARLAPDRPLLSLALPPVSTLPEGYTVDDLVSPVLEKLIETTPEPYYLGGWCRYGLLAYELARRLRARGKRVAIVILFDVAVPSLMAPAPDLRKMWRGVLRYQLRYHRASLRQLDTWEALAYVAERGWKWVRLMALRTRRLLAGSSRDGEAAPSLLAELEVTVRGFETRPYDGRVALIRAGEYSRRKYGITDESWGWNDFVTSGVEVHSIPGDHLTIFLEPAVDRLAGVVEDILKRA